METLRAVPGEATGVLRLDAVSFCTLSGIEVGYRRPVLELAGRGGVVGSAV